MIPCSSPFKKGMGLDFTKIFIFSKTYFDQKWGYWRSTEPILRPITTLGQSPIDPRGSRSISGKSFFRTKNHYFSPLNHRISTPGASGNHRGMCGIISWIYGYNTVHIIYSSSLITSFVCVMFGVILGSCLRDHFWGSFAGNGFSDLIRGIYLGTPI